MLKLTGSEIQKVLYSRDFTYRDEVKTLCTYLGLELVHNKNGNYDLGLDGYMVFKDFNEDFWKASFSEDSYSSGYLSIFDKVQRKERTVTVWE